MLQSICFLGLGELRTNLNHNIQYAIIQLYTDDDREVGWVLGVEVYLHSLITTLGSTYTLAIYLLAALANSFGLVVSSVLNAYFVRKEVKCAKKKLHRGDGKH